MKTLIPKFWSYEYLVDNVFNDLMDSYSKYIHQVTKKFNDFRINFPVTLFYIYKKDIKINTIKKIEYYIINCKTERGK